MKILKKIVTMVVAVTMVIAIPINRDNKVQAKENIPLNTNIIVATAENTGKDARVETMGTLFTTSVAINAGIFMYILYAVYIYETPYKEPQTSYHQYGSKEIESIRKNLQSHGD